MNLATDRMIAIIILKFLVLTQRVPHSNFFLSTLVHNNITVAHFFLNGLN